MTFLWGTLGMHGMVIFWYSEIFTGNISQRTNAHSTFVFVCVLLVRGFLLIFVFWLFFFLSFSLFMYSFFAAVLIYGK